MKFHYTAFDDGGHIISSGYKDLHDCVDWTSIDVKEVWFRYMGGLPEGTEYALISSQGESKLIWDIDEHMTTNVDLKTYKERSENVDEEINRRCRELGIDRRRQYRNQ